MEKPHFKYLIVSLLILGAVIAVVAKRPQKSVSQELPSVIPQAEASMPETATVDSPDGKIALIAKKEQTENGITYSYWFSDNATGVRKQIFTKTVSKDTQITIPYNTFSPDNKYIFLKESSPSKSFYFVVDGKENPDFSSLFYAKHPDYVITDATGWGGVNLVVFNTDKVGGGKGPSFWYEVGSNAFIQLSNRFE